MIGRCTKRLQKDLEAIQKNYSEQFKVELVNNNIMEWIVTVTGPKDSYYAGEVYKLRFRFPSEYPIESPEVIFIDGSPDHEHIYSNGFICMSILYDEWSAALTVASVCLSITSMMCSSTGKKRPANDAEFCKRSIGKGPKQFHWTYDDDKA